MKTLFLFLLCGVTTLFGASVRLINDSPYVLRAVVRGSDGALLGEMVVNAQHVQTWSGTNAQRGYYGKGNVYQEQPNRAQTPFAVSWYCMDGSDFSVCSGLSTGSTATALSCLGTRQCKPTKKKTPAPAAPAEKRGPLQSEEQHEEQNVGPPSY